MTSDAQAAITDIVGARILGLFLDSITTDHISPAGSIKAASPAGEYLIEQQGAAGRLQPVRHAPRQPRSHDARHLRQHPHQEPDGAAASKAASRSTIPAAKQMSIYDAAMRYKAEGVPLVVFAGKEYGTGSSRDWAAKGTTPARRARRHRAVLRAHPPLEPRRHGRRAVRVRGRHVLADARPQGRRDGHDPRA